MVKAKRLLKVLILFILFPLYWASANTTDYGWVRYPTFHGKFDDVVVTNKNVYFLSGHQLYSFSPEEEKLIAYDSLNYLSDNAVTGLFVGTQGDYVVVAYESGNLDVLYDNGKRLSLPEIKNSKVAGSKKINDVSFSGGKIIVCTDFGVVIYRESKMEVEESVVLNQEVLSACIFNDRLIICTPYMKTAHYLYYSQLKSRRNSIKDFIRLENGAYLDNLIPFDEELLLARECESNLLKTIKIDFHGNKIETENLIQSPIIQPIRGCKESVYAVCESRLLFFEKAGINENVLPDDLINNRIGIRPNATRLWAIDENGAGEFDFSGSEAIAKRTRLKPENATACENIGYMRWSNDGKRLYASNLCVSQYRGAAPGERSVGQYASLIENEIVHDISLLEASSTHFTCRESQLRNGDKRMYGDNNWIVEDPDNNSIYYCANNHEGIYVIQRTDDTDTKSSIREIGKLDLTNSPIKDFWGARANDVNIDKEGNLWVGYRGGGYAVLPSKLRKEKLPSVEKENWRSVDYFEGLKLELTDMMSLICHKSDACFFIQGKYQSGLIAMNNQGTLLDFSDDFYSVITSFTDQDGNVFSCDYITFLLEDKKGRVWVGSTSGVFVIDDPLAFLNDSFSTVRRPKVAQNAETVYADFLLEKEQVNWMAENADGEIWIATEHSGIYLVSESGEKILQRYSVDNSPLPSNTVNTIECQPNGNRVYVGTPNGVYTFIRQMKNAAPIDYKVRVYPNPLRPEHLGGVTIEGLPEGGRVRITDSIGQIVYQAEVQSNLVHWGATNGAANLTSGIYFVYLITEEDGGPQSKLVAKVAIVR